ncbi:hypothetical protein IW261DRAFT_204359 [Armillaria novae-zelandiae]|uniref:Uncharacterized protein n=1 Tax=Armillaria novae-zelandiae TaxID=153914 RepID=A0AA39N9J8_9AGAR|nr:hypothetical protein IW261DRAFT_204359 [Armillaria novae-zelandiae]
MYTNESYRMKATRKYGKTERKIVKVHWTPSQSNVKERDGCCQYTHVWRDQKTVYGYAIRERVLLLEAGMHRRMRRGIYSSGGLRCLLYCRVGTKNLTRTRVIKSVCAVKVRFAAFLHFLDVDWTLGRRSKDGKMQVKHQEYACGNKGSLSALFADTNLIQSMPQGMGPVTTAHCDRLPRDTRRKWIRIILLNLELLKQPSIPLL